MQELYTMQDLDQLVAAQPLVLLYITGKQCGVCTAIKPRIIDILQRHPEITPATAVVETAPEIAGQLSVFTLPAVLVYAQGRETIREARYFSLGELESRIERLIELMAE